MATLRSHKRKENPNYQFLVSWKPDWVRVKGEQLSSQKPNSGKASKAKLADSLAQQAATSSLKKDLIKSLILVSLIIIFELVVYLAWIKL